MPERRQTTGGGRGQFREHRRQLNSGLRQSDRNDAWHPEKPAHRRANLRESKDSLAECQERSGRWPRSPETAWPGCHEWRARREHFCGATHPIQDRILALGEYSFALPPNRINDGPQGHSLESPKQEKPIKILPLR